VDKRGKKVSKGGENINKPKKKKKQAKLKNNTTWTMAVGTRELPKSLKSSRFTNKGLHLRKTVWSFEQIQENKGIEP